MKEKIRVLATELGRALNTIRSLSLVKEAVWVCGWHGHQVVGAGPPTCEGVDIVWN